MPTAPIRYLTEADVLALLPSIEVQIGLVEGVLHARFTVLPAAVTLLT
jgi:hypothetical protein